ncbi:MAG TPA: hypothetical protein VM328_10020 [Fimbriimonadaceae bacterium]|nr:hypothetical protein [Fimbriimonadaceae bacterium]
MSKLQREERLTSLEAERLDQALEAQANPMLQALPEDTVSLSWRSALNERLLEQSRPVRSPMLGLWRPVLGLGLAGALAFAFLINRRQDEVRVVSGPNLEATLIQEHIRTDQYLQIAGAGLAAHEARPVVGPVRDVGNDLQDLDYLTL